MCMSLYTHYYRVMKKYHKTISLSSPLRVSDQIRHNPLRYDGIGSEFPMSNVVDVWTRINGLLVYMPVRVVPDHLMKRSILISNDMPDVRKLLVRKTDSSELIEIPLTTTCRITSEITGPKTTIVGPTLVDSGAIPCCMSTDLFLSLGYTLETLRNSDPLHTANRNVMDTRGLSDPLAIRLGGEIFWTSFIIVDHLCSPIILGWTFMINNDGHMHARDGTIELRPAGRKVIARNETFDGSEKPFNACFVLDQRLEPADGAVMKLSLGLNKHQERQMEGRQVIVLPLDKANGKKNKKRQASRRIGIARTISVIQDGHVMAPIFNAHESAQEWARAGQIVAKVYPSRTEYETVIECEEPDLTNHELADITRARNDTFLLTVNGIQPVLPPIFEESDDQGDARVEDNASDNPRECMPEGARHEENKHARPTPDSDARPIAEKSQN